MKTVAVGLSLALVVLSMQVSAGETQNETGGPEIFGYADNIASRRAQLLSTVMQFDSESGAPIVVQVSIDASTGRATDLTISFHNAGVSLPKALLKCIPNVDARSTALVLGLVSAERAGALSLADLTVGLEWQKLAGTDKTEGRVDRSQFVARIQDGKVVAAWAIEAGGDRFDLDLDGANCKDFVQWSANSISGQD